jgi:hypothetical protein
MYEGRWTETLSGGLEQPPGQPRAVVRGSWRADCSRRRDARVEEGGGRWRVCRVGVVLLQAKQSGCRRRQHAWGTGLDQRALVEIGRNAAPPALDADPHQDAVSICSVRPELIIERVRRLQVMYIATGLCTVQYQSLRVQPRPAARSVHNGREIRLTGVDACEGATVCSAHIYCGNAVATFSALPTACGADSCQLIPLWMLRGSPGLVPSRFVTPSGWGSSCGEGPGDFNIWLGTGTGVDESTPARHTKAALPTPLPHPDAQLQTHSLLSEHGTAP